MDPIQYGQENAIWIQSKFFRGFAPTTGDTVSLKELSNLVSTLKNNNIKYAYIFSGPYGTDGHLPEYAFSATARRSVDFLNKNIPEVMVLPWVGGVQDRTVKLWDSTWCNNALQDSKRLVELLGVAGLHVDFEYILRGEPFLDKDLKPEMVYGLRDYGKKVNNFHRKLREIIPGTFISSVVASTSSGTKPWKRKTSMAELRELLRYVDQISFLFYDTGIDNRRVFESNCRELISDIRILSSEYPKVQYLVGIGTFVNDPHLYKYRNLEIESIPNTLKTIKTSIRYNNPSNSPVIDGIAIYCEWATTKYQWGQFYENWIMKEK